MAIAPELLQRFLAPPPGFGPTPLWWWSGEPVTHERLRWQLDRFHEGGVDDLVVIDLAPSGPQFGAVADDPAWFSDAWWDRFTDVCDLAADRGMRLWFYDQIGFSGANLQGRVVQEHPEAGGRALRAQTRGARDGRAPVAPGEELVAAYDAAGRRVATGPDGALAGSRGGDLLVVTTRATAFDYLSRDAVALLLDRVHGEFDRRVPQHLGTTVVGSFQDELPPTSSWTAALPDRFAARHGYDLLDHLPALFGPGDVDAARVRSDFAAVRAELTEEALFAPLGEWHAARGMLVGADQSNPARAGLPVQSTQIYTDYPRTHRHLSAVGSDHEGDSKVHSSLAHLYGHERVWLEAFHSSGWGGTLEDTWDWLLPFLRSGATLYNPHASYYSTVGGWFEWAPPSTDWRQPYWPLYRRFADAVARTTAVLTWGRYEADVAVLHPTATVQACVPLDAPIDHFPGEEAPVPGAVTDVAATQATYLDLVGKDDWFHFRPSALDAAGIAFDVLDDASLQRATSAGGRLRIREQAYSTVVVPSSPFLEQASAQALLDLLAAGGRVVVVGEAPRHATGRAGDDAVVRELLEHRGCARVVDAAAAVAALPARDQHVRADLPLLVRRSGTTGAALLVTAYPNASGHPLRPGPGPGHWEDHDFDRRRYAGDHEVVVAATVRQAQVWDPATGARRDARVEAAGQGRSRVHVEAGGAPAVLVVWEEVEGPAAPALQGAVPAPDAPPRVRDVSDGWTGELVATLDNTWGDVGRPVGRDVSQLEVWSCEGAEEDAEEDADGSAEGADGSAEDADRAWAPVRATWGQRVLVCAPAAVDLLPAPLTAAECRDAARGRRPLGDPARGAWSVHEHSASRGPHREAGVLGLKGRIPAEFVVVPGAGPGEEVVVRALLVTDHRGPADLVIASPAPVTAWWDGQPLDVPAGYRARIPVEVVGPVSVLEYRLGAPAAGDNPLARAGGLVGSSVALLVAGTDVPHPEHMRTGDPALRPAGSTTFTAPLPELGGLGRLQRAVLVVGAARAATVRLAGRVVARQAKVEYYESAWGAAPAYFRHDVTDLLRELTAEAAAGGGGGSGGGAGAVLEVELESADAADVAFVDLAVVGEEGVRTLVSGAGWTARTAGTTTATRPDARQWMPLESAHAVRRPHPLPAAEWLLGPPEVGAPALDVALAADAPPRHQLFRVLLPAGARRVHLPLALPATVALDGRPLDVTDGVVELPEPLPRPAVLRVRTAPTAVHRGGAAWTGPLLVEHEAAPIALGDWRDVGLAAWSGGVRYRRTVQVPRDRPWTLDLGDLRGAVEVALDGEVVAQAFCAPYRWTLRPLERPVEVSVTVYGTLGPLLHESTSTTWVFPSQRATGLFGPVTTTSPSTAPQEVRR